MDKYELANRSLMTEPQAEMLLDAIKGMALFNAEMLIELSLNGFRAFEILSLLENDPLYLISYLAIRESRP